MKKKAAILVGVVGAILGTVGLFKSSIDKIEKIKKLETLNYKNDAILKVFTKWLKLKQDGNSVAEYLSKKGYKTIAIYGMHYLGECLLDELKDSEIEVKYAIDKNADQILADVDMYTLDDDLSEVDAIIVTAFWFFEEIVSSIRERVNCSIISLEDVFYEIECNE